MSERWIPVVAAVVGVLGGMGGAYVGGYVANEGQKQRFEEQQVAQRLELRRETFAAYLRAVQGVITGSHAETLLTPEANVEIVAQGREVREAALDVAASVDVFIRGRERKFKPDFLKSRNRFIEAAKAELTAEGAG
jgi:hypothetical protein